MCYYLDKNDTMIQLYPVLFLYFPVNAYRTDRLFESGGRIYCNTVIHAVLLPRYYDYLNKEKYALMETSRRNFFKLIGGVSVASAATALYGCERKKEVEHVRMNMDSIASDKYDTTFFLQVNESKCHGCHTCTELCPTGIIDSKTPGEHHTIASYDGCVNCAQCLINCPYGAIEERVSFIDEIMEAIKDPAKTVVAMPAPAVRYAIGEPFGMKHGDYAGGKMFAALRKLGFDVIWDNEFAADLTIIEEGTELVGRITGKIKKPLPQFTSCCPGWIKFVESFYPELIPNLSTCKSPIGMLGALAKTYGAKNKKIDPKTMYTVSIMPCVAKKFEGLRPEMKSSGYRDIDATITTRELAYMIKKAGIDFASLSDEQADPLLGASTGAATIFGVSGGVMEAALRYAYEAVTGRILSNLDFTQIRGTKGVREASVNLPGGPELKVCIVSGLSNVKPVVEDVKAGRSPYHFIEVMTCPDGCVNGGGQPLDPANTFVF